MRMTKERFNIWTGLVVLFLLAITNALSQTQVKPGFNIFSQEEDVEIGRQSASEVEQQLPILNERGIQRYVSGIGKRLAPRSAKKESTKDVVSQPFSPAVPQ